MDEDVKLTKVRQRVAKLRGFYTHLLIYAVVMAGLFLIDFLSGGGWWFYWPLFGWGIGVALHALSVFGFERLWGPQWEQKKIDELMKRD